MSTLTSRLKLTKPAGADQVDITILDTDFDLMDGEVGVPIVPASSALPSVPFDGQVRFDKNDGFLKQYDAASTLWKAITPGAGALLQGALGAWKNIVPTLTNITPGTVTNKNLFDYIRLPGNLIFWKYLLVLGTGGAITGVAAITLPAEFPYDLSAGVTAGVNGDSIGFGRAVAAVGRGVIATINGTGPPGNMSFSVADSGLLVQNGQPGAWAAGNTITAQGFYRTSAANNVT